MPPTPRTGEKKNGKARGQTKERQRHGLRSAQLPVLEVPVHAGLAHLARAEVGAVHADGIADRAHGKVHRDLATKEPDENTAR